MRSQKSKPPPPQQQQKQQKKQQPKQQLLQPPSPTPQKNTTIHNYQQEPENYDSDEMRQHYDPYCCPITQCLLDWDSLDPRDISDKENYKVVSGTLRRKLDAPPKTPLAYPTLPPYSYTPPAPNKQTELHEYHNRKNIEKKTNTKKKQSSKLQQYFTAINKQQQGAANYDSDEDPMLLPN
jgi:hypothetical protein